MVVTWIVQKVTMPASQGGSQSIATVTDGSIAANSLILTSPTKAKDTKELRGVLQFYGIAGTGYAKIYSCETQLHEDTDIVVAIANQ